MAVETDDLLQNLRNWGCDVDGAMDRFLGEKELYRKCLAAVVEDKAFEMLEDALRKGDAQKAFEAGHTLKGVLANLGLTPMYEVSVKIVEPLRKGEAAGLYPFYEELMSQNCFLKKMLGLE